MTIPTTVTRKVRALRDLGLSCLLLVLGTSAMAQLGPTAEQINTTTPGDQLAADVAISADGTTLVVWESEFVVRGRLFDSTGQAKGPDFLFDDGVTPAVALEPSGDFIVVWDHLNTIQAQRLDTEGSFVGAQFRVSIGSNLSSPDVAVAPTGEMLVTWDASEAMGGATGGKISRLETRHFDATGIGSEVAIVDLVTCEDLFCDTLDSGGVVSGTHGEFVVAWERNIWYLEPLREDIVVSRFSADGTALGAEMVVSTDPDSYLDSPSIAYRDDHYLVVWESEDPMADGSGRGVVGRFLDPEGVPVGSELQINTSTLGDQRRPTVSPVPSLDPSFLVVWQDEEATPVTLRGQQLAVSGLVGAEIALTTGVPGDQQRPAADQGTVVWDSDGSPGDDTDGTSIQGRALARPHLFADGFESGDTTAWEATSGTLP